MRKTDEKPLFTPEELAITPYNTADYLKTDEDMAGYLEACLEEGGPEIFLLGLRDVLKAKGIKRVATDAGLSRESLYKTCAPGRKPQFDTIWKITKALGISLGFSTASPHGEEKSGTPKKKRSRKREAVMA